MRDRLRHILQAWVARAVDEQALTDAMLLGLEWRWTVDQLGPRQALTLAFTGRHATASVFVPDDEGHAELVESVGGESEVEALQELRRVLP